MDSSISSATCVKPRQREFLSECGSRREEATFTRGVIAKHSTPARQRPMTWATRSMSAARWGGHRYLTPELLAETVAGGNFMKNLIPGLFLSARWHYFENC